MSLRHLVLVLPLIEASYVTRYPQDEKSGNTQLLSLQVRPGGVESLLFIGTN